MKYLSGYEGMLCGKMPNLWQKEIDLTMEILYLLRRDSSWIKEWGSGKQLKLCQEPLTGKCLTELVGSVGKENESSMRGHPAENITRLTIESPPFIKNVEIGKELRNSSLPNSWVKYSTGDTLQTDKLKADQKEWCALSGEHNCLLSTAPKLKQSSEIEAARPILPRSLRDIHGRNKESMSEIKKSLRANKDLFTGLADVVPDMTEYPQNRLITRHPVSNGINFATMPSGAVEDYQSWLKELDSNIVQSLYKTDMNQITSSLSDHHTSPHNATFIESQGKRNLSGPKAPENLLTDISKKSLVVFNRTNSPEHTPPKHTLEKLAEKGQLGSPSITIDDSGKNTELVVRPDTHSLLDKENNELPGPKSLQTGATIGLGRNSNNTTQIAETEVSLPLPSMLPLQEVPRHQASTQESSVIHSPRQGLIDSEENMDILAQKIKRILDDEARRHGINV